MPSITKHSPQNPEELQLELIQTHYDAITASYKTAAVSVLHTAQCIHDAKWGPKALNKTSFKALEVRLGGKSALSKFLTIGKRAAAMMIRVDLLPASSNSIYNLSRLEPDKFDEFVLADKITKTMTMGDTAALLDKPIPSLAETLMSITVKADPKTQKIQHDYPDETEQAFNAMRAAAKVLVDLGVTVKLNYNPVAEAIDQNPV